MMTKDGGERIATSCGAVLVDRDQLGDLAAGDALFEPSRWAAQSELVPVNAGRGAAWYVGPAGHWVLRHYRRGGWVAAVSADRYFWIGERRVRAFAEFRLLSELKRLGLPVPEPVAARYQRVGGLYRCDLITLRIPGARTLCEVLGESAVSAPVWHRVGAAVARLHEAGVDHADLNAHNILLTDDGVSVIDFDRSRRRPRGAWARANIARLQRSLSKVTAGLPADRFPPAAWRELLAGYSPG